MITPTRNQVADLAARYDICGFGSFAPIYGAPREVTVELRQVHIKNFGRSGQITIPVWHLVIRQEVESSDGYDSWTHYKTTLVGVTPFADVYSKLRLDRPASIMQVRFYGDPKTAWYDASDPIWEHGVGWILTIND